MGATRKGKGDEENAKKLTKEQFAALDEFNISPLQLLWAEAVMINWNPTDACRSAGYTGSENALRVQGHKNIRNEKIRKYIASRAKEVVSASEVLHVLRDQMYANISAFVEIVEVERKNELGKTEKVQTLRLNKAAIKTHGHLIRQIKQTSSGVTLTMVDSLAAAQLLGRSHALFEDKITISEEEAEVRQAIKDGIISIDELTAMTGDRGLAEELFIQAGVKLSPD